MDPNKPDENSTPQNANINPPKPTDNIVTEKPKSFIFNAKCLSDLLHEIDPNLQIDQETEETLVQIAEEFIENVTAKSAKLANHRGSKLIEAKDIKFSVEKDWDILIPGFPAEEKVVKRSYGKEAHRQRLALIKKQIRKM